jgi:hypothetical protein
MLLREFEWHILYGVQIPAIENTRRYHKFDKGVQYTSFTERQQSSF